MYIIDKRPDQIFDIAGSQLPINKYIVNLKIHSEMEKLL